MIGSTLGFGLALPLIAESGFVGSITIENKAFALTKRITGGMEVAATRIAS